MTKMYKYCGFLKGEEVCYKKKNYTINQKLTLEIDPPLLTFDAHYFPPREKLTEFKVVKYSGSVEFFSEGNRVYWDTLYIFIASTFEIGLGCVCKYQGDQLELNS